MNTPFDFDIQVTRFDEHYVPSEKTRTTTNFANLARGENRQRNLRNALRMVDNRFNDLAPWDNPGGDRYGVELDIVSVEVGLHTPAARGRFPLIEILKVSIHDRRDNKRIEGLGGNNFSSYVRDYDFSVRLPAYNSQRQAFGLPEDFGDLHGKLFQQFAASSAYRAHFNKPPVICISVSTSQTYHRSDNQHPILGVEFRQEGASATDLYFAKMGMQVRFFMPPRSVAPLAFYFFGDLLSDYTNLELIGTISTMETFQKIYRPEIYSANAAAGKRYRPSLNHQDYSVTQVVYDREERRQLAAQQGRFAEQHFIKPYGQLLERWAAQAVF